MDFSTAINDYKKSTLTQSPIWIWFAKGTNCGRCLICDHTISIKNASTSNLIFHLKQTHGCLKKYNAYKEYEELNQLKECQKKKRKQSFVQLLLNPFAAKILGRKKTKSFTTPFHVVFVSFECIM